MVRISEIKDLEDIRGVRLEENNPANALKFIEELGDEYGDLLKSHMSEHHMLVIHQAYLEAVNNHIDDLIFQKTGQKRYPTGTLVECLSDFSHIKKGSFDRITNVTRFDEDTFGQGWYCYTVAGERMYANEFRVVEEDKG